MKNSQYTANRIRDLVSEAWGELARACNRLGSGSAASWLREAEEIALRQEKQHRAMGARFTHGQASYRVPASTAARAIIISNVYGGPQAGHDRPLPPLTWGAVAATRADVALAYAIHEALTLEDLAKLEACAAISYSEDIAA